MNKKWFYFFSGLIWILIWQIGALLVAQSLFLPSPVETFTALMQLMQTGSFYQEVMFSLYRIIYAFGLSVLLGLFLGVPAAIYPKFEIFIEPVMAVLKSTPVMSFILLFILWFRLDMVPVAVGLFMCLPLIYKNVVEGIHNVDHRLVDMSKIYQVNKWNVFKGIYLQSMQSYLYSAMNVSLGLAFRVIVAAEVLANPRYGIGSRLYGAKVYFETEEMFAWTLVIILLSFFVEQLLKIFMKKEKKGNRNAG